MNCPRCNTPLERKRHADGALVFHCPKCAWGADTAAESKHTQRESPPRPAIGIGSFVKLFALWIISLLIIFGPYAVIVYGLPQFIDTQGWRWERANSAQLAASMNPNYWIVVGIYLGLAYVLTPKVYTGPGAWLFFDNPFSFEDDVNRASFKLLILLLPGKIVLSTLGATARLFQVLIFRSS